jgi:hypothetical protein
LRAGREVRPFFFSAPAKHTNADADADVHAHADADGF